MGFVYFISDEKNLKIGFTKDLEKRKKELQTGNAKKLTIKCYIENVEMTFEKHLHYILEDYRLEGEWFKKEALIFLLTKTSPWFKTNIRKYPNEKTTII